MNGNHTGRWGLSAVMLIGVLLGVAVVRIHASPVVALGVVLAVMVGTLIVRAGPHWCIAAIAALVGSGLSVHVTSIGPVDLRTPDLLYIPVAAWFLSSTFRAERHLRSSEGTITTIDRRPIVILLALTGISASTVLLTEPGFFQTSLISWIRLAQTASLIWLTAASITNRSQFALLLRMFAFATCASIVIAFLTTSPSPLSLFQGERRLGGLLGANSLGLVAAFLVLLSRYSTVLQRQWTRAAVLGCGLFGLVMSRSVASMVAAGVAFVIARHQDRADRGEPVGADLLTLLVRGVVTALAVLVAVTLVRPTNLPSSANFRQSSTMARLVLGAAGWEIFTAHPIFGVGWQRSASPEVIAEPELSDRLRQRFSKDVNPVFFPDVTPTSVHNAYIQVLADLGIIGALVFLFVLLNIRRRARELLGLLRNDPLYYQNARFLILCLVTFLVWWNDNPIYGGQVETIMAAIFLGAFIALSRMALAPSADASVPAPPTPASSSTGLRGTGRRHGSMESRSGLTAI